MAVSAAKTIPSNRIDTLLQRAIPLALIIVLLLSVKDVIQLHQMRSPWTIGDWLINFQAGFVRRGLLGEGVLQLGQFFGVNPGVIVVLLQNAVYGIFFFFVWRLIRLQTTLIPHLFLIFSPFIFVFQLYDWIGGYRKEILFFAVMAFVVWLARCFSVRIFERGFYIVLLGYPILILSHEMLAIWLPYLMIVYLYKVPLTQKRFILLAGLLALSVSAFVASFVFAGDERVAEAINLSLQPYGYSHPYGAVAFLQIDTLKAFTSTWTTAKDGSYLIYYPQIIVLCFLAFIPVRKSLSEVLATPWAKPLVIISVIGTVLIGLVGIDWGRFIYASFMPLFLLTLLVNTAPSAESFSIKRAVFFTLALLVYATSWFIPHAVEAFPYRWLMI